LGIIGFGYKPGFYCGCFSELHYSNHICALLATNNPPETETILAVFTMSNPGSFAWALEMYGWGGIGLSYIFMSLIFGKAEFEGILKTLFIINGFCSVASAIMTSINMNWLFSPAGFASLIVWNLLVLIIDIYLLKYFDMKY